MLDAIWTENIDMPSFPKLEKDMRTDVLIIGGGMAGLLCAYRLREAGVDCALIESDRILSGISRNTTAKITVQHGFVYHKLIREFDVDTARGYLQANKAALEAYRSLAGEIDCDFETRDNYVYSVDSEHRLEQELRALERIGAPAELVRELPLPIQTVGAIRFPKQAQFHPLKFGAGIAKGLHIYEHTKALSYDGSCVVTEQGRISAAKIIVATHFPMFNKHGGYFLKMYQHRSYAMALENATDVNGMYVDGAGDGFSFRNYGGLLLLGGGGHRTGKRGSGWRPLEELAQKHYPNAREVRRWAAQDCMSLDGIPYIGRYGKNTPELYVATGFNKWGMTSAMTAAMVLSDLVQGRENPWAPIFDPSRRALRPQLLLNGLEAGANLLTPTVPRCPHLGCALKWNPWEHSWDCPCHGSRFSEDGKLMDNPATDNMKNSRSR